MFDLHLLPLRNHSFITKLFLLIILPFVNLSPVREPGRPLGQFLAYLSSNDCMMPNNIKLPFPNSASEKFDFLNSPLEECGTAEAYNRNETSYVLCNEIFEVVINITCNEVNVGSEIISQVSENVCHDFQKLHSIVSNDPSYLGRRLNDNILCTLICNKHEDLCKFMSWSYGVLSRLNAIAADPEPTEENKAITAGPKATEKNKDIAGNPKSTEENKASAVDSKPTEDNKVTDSKPAEENKGKNQDADQEEDELNLPQGSANIKKSAGTNLANTLNHPEVTTGNYQDNSIAMISNISESSKTEQKSTSSDSFENVSITNKVHNNPTNPTSTIVSGLNDKTISVLPKSRNSVTVTIQSVELVNKVSAKFPGAETKVKQKDTIKMDIEKPITAQNDVAKELTAEKNVSSTRNSTVSSNHFSSTARIPIDQMDDENGMPQSVKFQDQYNDEENEVDIGGEYSKPEYDGYNPPVKVKDENSKGSNIATDDMATANLANKYNEFLYKRILDQDSEGVQIIPSFPEQEDSHFFFYLLSIVLILMAGYLIFHNKQKIIALIVEGRHERRRRSHNAGYKKLETK